MSSPKIFIADYDETSLNQLATIIQTAGYQVETTSSGRGAMETIHAIKPNACIIDPMIAGVDGFMLCRQIRDRYPSMATIISTAIYKGDRYQRDARTRFGVTAYLEKPYPEEQLLRVLNELAGPPSATYEAPESFIMDETASPTDDLEATVSGLEPFRPDADFDLVGDEQPKAPESFIMDDDIIPTEPMRDPKPDSDIFAQFREDEVAHTPPPPAVSPTNEPDPGILDAISDLDFTVKDEAPAPSPLPEPETESIIPEAEPEPAFKLTAGDIFGAVIEEVEAAAHEMESPIEPVQDPAAVDSQEDSLDQPLEPDGDVEWDTAPQLAPPESVESTNPDLTPSLEPEPEPPLFDFAEPDPIEDTDPDPMIDVPVADHDDMPSSSNDYEFLEKLGEDRMSEFWKAKRLGDKGFEKIVTIQQIVSDLNNDTDFLDLFTREARTVANLNHPSIGHINEMGRIGNSFFIAREYMNGETLESIFRRCNVVGRHLPPEAVAHLGARLAEALHYAHTRKGMDGHPLGLWHGGLSPRQIFISPDGEIKIIGFGMNACLAYAQQKLNRSDARDMRYLPPNDPQDARADIYALGAILYRALTGNQPTEFDPLDHTSGVPIALAEVIAAALGVAANAPAPTAAELAELLQHYLQGHGLDLDDEDLARHIETISNAPTMVSDTTTEPTPEPQPEPVLTPETGPTAPPKIHMVKTLDLDLEPSEPAPQSEPTGDPAPMPAVVPEEPAPRKVVAANSSKPPVALIAILVIIILAVLAWLFIPRSGSTDTPTPPPVNADTAAPTTQPGETTTSPPTDTAKPEPNLPEVSEADKELEAARKRLEKQREELRKMQEENKEKGNNQ